MAETYVDQMLVDSFARLLPIAVDQFYQSPHWAGIVYHLAVALKLDQSFYPEIERCGLARVIDAVIAYWRPPIEMRIPPEVQAYVDLVNSFPSRPAFAPVPSWRCPF